MTDSGNGGLSGGANTQVQQCDVVVVGAGIAGLVAGVTLAPSRDVVVLESSTRPGGRVESVCRGDYWLNIGAQFTEGTGVLFDVIDKYGIELGSLADAKVALYREGRTVRADNPVWMLLRSRMSLRAKVELALLGLRIQRVYNRFMANKDAEDARAYRAFLDS